MSPRRSSTPLPTLPDVDMSSPPRGSSTPASQQGDPPSSPPLLLSPRTRLEVGFVDATRKELSLRMNRLIYRRQIDSLAEYLTPCKCTLRQARAELVLKMAAVGRVLSVQLSEKFNNDVDEDEIRQQMTDCESKIWNTDMEIMEVVQERQGIARELSQLGVITEEGLRDIDVEVPAEVIFQLGGHDILKEAWQEMGNDEKAVPLPLPLPEAESPEIVDTEMEDSFDDDVGNQTFAPEHESYENIRNLGQW